MKTTYYALATVNTLVVLYESVIYYIFGYGVWKKADVLFSAMLTISKCAIGAFLVVSAVYYISALHHIIKLSQDLDGSLKINTKQLCAHFTSLGLYLLAIFA